MANVPGPSGKKPVEGDRGVIDRELDRSAKQGEHSRQDRGTPAGESSDRTAQPASPELVPGDEASPGTPGTGEDVCPQCRGTGQVQNSRCPNCRGTGRVVKAIGGA